MSPQEAKALGFQYKHDISSADTSLPRTVRWYLVEFIDRMQSLPDAKSDKIMRWLGFIQGALWALGYYTVDDLKEHSRKASKE